MAPPQFSESVSGAGAAVVVVTGATVVVTGSLGGTAAGAGSTAGRGAGVGVVGVGPVVVGGAGAVAGGNHGGAAVTVVGVGTEDGDESDSGAGAVTPGSAVFTCRGCGSCGRSVAAAAAAAAVSAATGTAAASTRARRGRGASARTAWSMARSSTSSLATNAGLGSATDVSSSRPSRERSSDPFITTPPTLHGAAQRARRPVQGHGQRRLRAPQGRGGLFCVEPCQVPQRDRLLVPLGQRGQRLAQKGKVVVGPQLGVVLDDGARVQQLQRPLGPVISGACVAPVPARQLARGDGEHPGLEAAAP